MPVIFNKPSKMVRTPCLEGEGMGGGTWGRGITTIRQNKKQRVVVTRNMHYFTT